MTPAATPLTVLEAVVVDCETTGLDANRARLVQIAALRVLGPEIDWEAGFERLVNPGVPIPAHSTTIHGIDDAAVADAPGPAEVLAEFWTFQKGAVIIGHTINFDIKILTREAGLAGVNWPLPRLLDVRHLAKIAAPTLADYTLNVLCDWLDIEIEGRHTAMGDAAATARVFAALVPKLQERGIRTLAEADAAARHTAEREALHNGTPMPRTRKPIERRPIERIDSYPYRHRVRDVMSAPPVVLPGDATLAQAAEVLVAVGISSVFVTDEAGVPGIVTERDLLRAVQTHCGEEQTVKLIDLHNAPLACVNEGAFLYRAIGRMDRLGVRHLGVIDSTGTLVGAVTTRDLLHHRSATAMMLGDATTSAQDARALAAAWAQTPGMVHRLLDEGVDPRSIAAVLSDEIKVMTRRAAELAAIRMEADGHGPAPCRHAVLVLGSAGRGESLLAADQDNAIIYETGEPGGPEDRWFEALGGHIADILNGAGVIYCPGGVMARNADWRKSVAEWRSTVDGWIGRQRKEDLLNVDIFFDAVPVSGDRTLGEDIWHYAYGKGFNAPRFRRALSDTLDGWNSPVGMFGTLRTGKEDRTDLKFGGLFPVFTAARVLSIKHGAAVRSSPDRLRAVVAAGRASVEEVERILDAHKLILGAVLAQQIEDIEAGRRPGTWVDVGRLPAAERRALVRALSHAAGAVNLVREGML